MNNRKSRRQTKKNIRSKSIYQHLFIVGGLVTVLISIFLVYTLIWPVDTNNSVTDNPTDNEALPEVGTEVGALAPDFELTNIEGQTVRLSDYRGKPIALTFMHTW